jgi:hypothetical protein
MTDTKQTHHALCGEVGETGEHGDLGSNAAGASRVAAQGAAEPAIVQTPAAVSRDAKVAGVKASLIAAGFDDATAGKMAETAVDKAPKQ